MPVTKPKKEVTSGQKLGFFARVSIGEEKDFFIENLSVLLASGMPIVPAIGSIKDEIRSKALKSITAEMLEEIAAGSTLWRALQRSGIFPAHFTSLVRIGEQSGRLAENLKILAKSQAKDKLFRQKIKAAMAYPVFIFFLILFVGLGVAWFIMPRLSGVFSQLNVKLPKITQIIIAIGDFLNTSGAIAVPGIAIGVLLLFYFIFFFPSSKFIGQKMIFALPLTRNIIQQTELSRAGYIMGSLLDAGMPIVEAMNSLSDSSTVANYKKFYNHLAISINQGNSFQKSFSTYKKSNILIPRTIQQMIIVSEQSGSMSQTFIRIGEMYEEKADISTKNLATILEPVLLVIVWFGVLAIALAVILPIYGLIGGMNNAIQ